MVIKTRKHRIDSPSAMAAVLQSILRAESRVDREKEHFWSIGLDPSGVIRYVDLVTLGIQNFNIVHPRETFRLAVIKGVAKVITAHNHPSGSLRPSPEDMAIVKRLIQSGEILGISVIDHLIITEVAHRSLSGQRYFK